MESQYLGLLSNILDNGVTKGDRTGTGTLSLFGEQISCSLSAGFPLLTTKKLPMRWIAEELFWFLRGSTDEGELRTKGVDIWREWATKEQCARFGRPAGDLGPVYGHQWRNFSASFLGRDPQSRFDRYANDGVDQIGNALALLENSPDSRRIIVSGWNPREATQVALPPCHTMFQFATHEETRSDEQSFWTRRVLHCHMYQRSADVFLGVPFNIASYALLTHIFAEVLDYEVGSLTISFGDVHIYQNHVEQVKEQLSRKPRALPRITVSCDQGASTPLDKLLSIGWHDILVSGYDPHPKIAAEVAV